MSRDSNSVNRPLIEDPDFLDNLSRLDEGLSGAGRGEGNERAPLDLGIDPTPIAFDDALERLDPPAQSAPRSTSRRRPLLDMFPVDQPITTAPRQTARRSAASTEESLWGTLEPRADSGAMGCESFYGFDEKPFGSSPDPRFLYHSRSYDRIAEQLVTAVHDHANVIVTAEPGIGKTLLCRTIGMELDRRTLTSFILQPLRSPEALLKTLLADFGVIPRADATAEHVDGATCDELRAKLRDFVVSLGHVGASAVVFIDDAQQLSANVADELCRLSELGGEAQLMQVVLVGRPALTSMLRQPQYHVLHQRFTVRLEMGPLESEELSGYVAHRLAVANPRARVEFDPQTSGDIFELTRGTPSLVNELCDRALTLGYNRSESVIGADLILEAAHPVGEAPAAETAVARAARIVASVAACLVLMLIGGAASAFTFQSRLSRTIAAWEARPELPSPVIVAAAYIQPISPPPVDPNPVVDADNPDEDSDSGDVEPNTEANTEEPGRN